MAPTICVQQLSKTRIADSGVDEKKERALLAHSFITPGCHRQKLQSYVDGSIAPKYRNAEPNIGPGARILPERTHTTTSGEAGGGGARLGFLPEHYDSIDEPSKFLFLNSMLPSGKRFKPTPQSSANMNYVDVTEEGLVWLLRTIFKHGNQRLEHDFRQTYAATTKRAPCPQEDQNGNANRSL
ncbi:unnamed protein product [Umbelopsis vinacea]